MAPLPPFGSPLSLSMNEISAPSGGRHAALVAAIPTSSWWIPLPSVAAMKRLGTCFESAEIRSCRPSGENA